MDLVQKLKKLKEQHNLTLYKWTAGKCRLDGDMIFLSDLRLNALSCWRGRVTFSAAAPVLYMDRGRTRIVFLDSDVLKVMEGPRHGINIKSAFLHEHEKAMQAKACGTWELNNSETYPTWMAHKVLSLGCSQLYPAARLVTPNLYRISKDPTNFRPLYTAAMIRAIGGQKTDPEPVLRQKFLDHLYMFGAETDSGFAIAAEYVATGGCCVVGARGITVRSGSISHMMPTTTFMAECACKKWQITTGAEDDLERANGNVPEPDSSGNCNNGA